LQLLIFYCFSSLVDIRQMHKRFFYYGQEFKRETTQERVANLLANISKI